MRHGNGSGSLRIALGKKRRRFSRLEGHFGTTEAEPNSISTSDVGHSINASLMLAPFYIGMRLSTSHDVDVIIFIFNNLFIFYIIEYLFK